MVKVVDDGGEVLVWKIMCKYSAQTRFPLFFPRLPAVFEHANMRECAKPRFSFQSVVVDSVQINAFASQSEG